MGKIKGAAPKLELSSVSPSWKVLQMKINEEKADKEREAASKPKKESQNKNGRKRKLAEALNEVSKSPKEPKMDNFSKKDNLLALDCEYVGGGYQGADDILARVSIVNSEGEVVYDKYVQPRDKITDFRTAVSGIRPGNLINATPFQTVQFEVAKLIENKIIIGHAIHNDFRVLNISHSKKNTRDTAKCKLLRDMANFQGRIPSLKKLAEAVLGIDIQKGEHDSVTDARVALRLYDIVKKKWEAEIKRFHRK